MLEISGYIGAVLIGVSLGLIGGGGSILTVPVLVYLIGTSPVMATAYSLFIVGTSSLVGSIRYARKGQLDLKTAMYFGIPSIIAVYLTRRFLVPAIPDEVFSSTGFNLTKDLLLMLLFAALMVVASLGMIRRRTSATTDKKTEHRAGWVTPLVILVEGFVVGTLTGLVGAGGGFLIIPALVLFAGLEMKVAIGTSLLIIAAKSLIGFSGDLANYSIEWPFLLSFTGLAIIGIFIGSFLATKIDGSKLKTAFGWFVLVMGVFILWKELF
jgi:uncharacterized membrane protein YfcA